MPRVCLELKLSYPTPILLMILKERTGFFPIMEAFPLKLSRFWSSPNATLILLLCPYIVLRFLHRLVRHTERPW